MSGAVADVPGTYRGSGATAISLPVASTSFAEGWYDVDVDVWSGTPGTSPYVVLVASGWLNKTLSVDATPPVTTVVLTGTAGLLGWYRSSVQVVLNATESVGTVTATWYRLDAANETPYTLYASPVSVATDGDHSIAYYSVDSAGNTEAPHSMTFKIDATPPAVALASPTSGEDLPNGTFTVTWTATDGGSGLAYTTIRLDGSAPINVSRATNVHVPRRGQRQPHDHRDLLRCRRERGGECRHVRRGTRPARGVAHRRWARDRPRGHRGGGPPARATPAPPRLIRRRWVGYIGMVSDGIVTLKPAHSIRTAKPAPAGPWKRPCGGCPVLEPWP